MSDSKRYSTLVNNTILFAISNFGSKIISLIIQPYLSYALASPDVMGVTSLMQSVANLLIPVVSLGVSFAVIRFGLDRKVDKSSVFMNGLATILLGFAYLVATKTIQATIPVTIVATVFILTTLNTGDPYAALIECMSGGLLFGSVFMATDYVTSPFTLKGKLIYGVALGIVTFAIRYWGSYTEGVSFALLFMNLWVPYINDLTRQTPYGYVKPAKKAKEGAGK